ncbi:MAG: hypothetical protein ABR981_00885 [Candidatus Micrarchaeaceae archaeon]
MGEFIKVWKEGNYYIAEIPTLHIGSISNLKRNLKEAIVLTVESLVKDDLKLKGKKAKNAIDTLTVPLIASLNTLPQKKRPVSIMAKA